jgi:hypothetical protein
MNKTAMLLVMGLALAGAQGRGHWCYDDVPPPPNPELQRQEVINLENEAARAILLKNGTFFRRVYADDFTGTLSSGQAVDKSLMIAAVQTQEIKYESFNASDIHVRLFRDTAVATCLWSVRAISGGQRITSQLRTTHVYVYIEGGFRVVAGHATMLPPFTRQIM